ncbi:MAG: hypothetical protein WCL70_13385 [Paludibacter sp.]
MNLKYNILGFIILFISLQNYAQNTYNTYHFPKAISSTDTVTYKSSDGYECTPRGTYRSLVILINIVYDQISNDTVNKYTDQSTIWMPDNKNSINVNPPPYLQNIFDIDLKADYSYTANATRLYAESSFNQLLMLGDYMVVNIKQSTITPTNPLNGFEFYTLLDAVISLINSNGGLNTIYSHNNPAEYDKTAFLANTTPLPDNKIDNVQFLVRNTFSKTYRDKYGNLILKHNYGSVNAGQGFSGGSFTTVNLNIGGSAYGSNYQTYQCIGGGNFATTTKSILTHEIAHHFLGGNEFHTSGGVTINDPTYASTFMGIQYGYGLFNGGLTSCNAYERWRLDWRSPSNTAYRIASNGVNSDIISKFVGEQTYILRDFVSTGDAIRIKLPYKDNYSSSNQYIWLENHQSAKNNKLDEQTFSFQGSCRDENKAGIYSYYQVGKDILDSTYYRSVYPTNEKDNLRIISAEGNFNVIYKKDVQDCLNYAPQTRLRPQFEYTTENPFHGVNDQTEVYSYDTSKSHIVYQDNGKFMGSKIKNTVLEFNNLPWIGDKFDAFIPTSTGKVIDISSNPSSNNTTTNYTINNTANIATDFYSTDDTRNTKKIYLTGLSIKMIDPDPSNTGMKAYTVKVRWDDFDVKQDVNWSGDIVLKEQLNLLSGKKIILNQNLTPCQINNDPISGYFAPTTFFTCESNTIFNMASSSAILLKDKSSFVMNASSTMTLQDGAMITVESGSTLQIKASANLNIQGSGKILVKSGGYICVETGANINLQDYNSLITLEEGAIYGANPLLFTSPSCSGTITKTGNGAIADFNQDMYIQNLTISASRYIGGKNIYVGNHVTTTQAGDVIINNGANVIFDCKNITFDAGFECVAGSTYEVKNH